MTTNRATHLAERDFIEISDSDNSVGYHCISGNICLTTFLWSHGFFVWKHCRSKKSRWKMSRTFLSMRIWRFFNEISTLFTSDCISCRVMLKQARRTNLGHLRVAFAGNQMYVTNLLSFIFFRNECWAFTETFVVTKKCKAVQKPLSTESGKWGIDSILKKLFVFTLTCLASTAANMGHNSTRQSQDKTEQ